ncbi:MAG TPA: hypothetical protein VGG07_09500 [Solirubrobacteraceae bacterium]|jgi:uncharacterized membrane protein YczE
MSRTATTTKRRVPTSLGRLLAPVPPDRRARRFAQLVAGLIGYGVTASMMVLAGLGLDPWDVFHQGLSRTFGLGIGTWAVIASVVVLVCGWTPLHQRPGVGTVMNAVMVGFVMDVILATVHTPHALWARIALLVGGVIGNGLATGFYIGAGLGPGPRDGLSTGIAGRGFSMRVVRTTIEGTVLVTGFLLGGTIGVGTLLYATAIGPITHLTIPALAIGRRRGAGAPAAQGVRDVRQAPGAPDVPEAPGAPDVPAPTREPARVTQNL